MRKTNELFIANNFYHVYNRAVGSEKMFKQEKNYSYFLQKMQQYILPVADVYCYSLLPNHFHLLVRIKSEEIIESIFQSSKIKSLQAKYDINRSLFIAEQFGNWCNAYTKAFNKMYNRKGKLFMDNLNRRKIDDEFYYTKIIHYIHANAVQHGICKEIKDWLYSSYQILTGNTDTFLKRDELMDWFGNKDAFIKFHQQPVEIKMK
jgi:REP element-mobilizing transposase RayT